MYMKVKITGGKINLQNISTNIVFAWWFTGYWCLAVYVQFQTKNLFKVLQFITSGADIFCPTHCRYFNHSKLSSFSSTSRSVSGDNVKT
jgi:hypothetical protein